MGDIVPFRGEDAISALFLPDSVGSAFRDHGITPAFIVGELAEILKTNRITVDDKGNEKYLIPPRDRLAAAKLLLDVAEKSAHISGLVEKISGHAERCLPNGTQVTLDSESMRLMRDGSDRTLRTLALLREDDGSRIIDLENEDVRVITGQSGPRASDGGVHGDGGAEDDPDQRPSESEPRSASDHDEIRVGDSEGERGTGVLVEPPRSDQAEAVGGEGSRTGNGNQSDPEQTEWWNERTSPAAVAAPVSIGGVGPAIPGAVAAAKRKAAVIGPVPPPATNSNPGASGIAARLRTLYLKTHPPSELPGPSPTGQPGGS